MPASKQHEQRVLCLRGCIPLGRANLHLGRAFLEKAHTVHTLFVSLGPCIWKETFRSCQSTPFHLLGSHAAVTYPARKASPGVAIYYKCVEGCVFGKCVSLRATLVHVENLKIQKTRNPSCAQTEDANCCALVRFYAICKACTEGDPGECQVEVILVVMRCCSSQKS